MQRIAAHSGFTLIELLVTISIMALVMGGSIAAYLSFQTKQEVLTAAKNVQQLVRTAQGKARVRETPTSAACSGVNKLQGYRIKLSGGQIQIIALCGTSLSSFSEAVTVSTQSFPTGVSYSSSSPTDIDFYTLYRGVAVYPSGAFPATLEFTSSSDAALRYRFTLGSGGAISDLEAF